MFIGILSCDYNIKQGDIIIANIAYDAPTNKSLDEIEMDGIICTAGTSSEGSLTNKFKINYTTQWL